MKSTGHVALQRHSPSYTLESLVHSSTTTLDLVTSNSRSIRVVETQHLAYIHASERRQRPVAYLFFFNSLCILAVIVSVAWSESFRGHLLEGPFKLVKCEPRPVRRIRATCECGLCGRRLSANADRAPPAETLICVLKMSLFPKMPFSRERRRGFGRRRRRT